MIVFRMHSPMREVFDTTGSFLFPGRWHSRGTRVVYSAEHASLAVLETLIHASEEGIPGRSISRIHVPDGMPIESAPWLELPASQYFGDTWVRERRSAVLRVESIAVNRMESNFVFNPAHPDFPAILSDAPIPFVFDPRLFPPVRNGQ